MFDRFTIWKRFISPEERILWCGREAVFFGMGNVPVLIPVILVLVLYKSMTYDALMNTQEKLRVLAIFSTLIMGGYFLLWLALFRKNERYCITDRRVAVKQAGEYYDIPFEDIESIGHGSRFRTMIDEIRENDKSISESFAELSNDPKMQGLELPELSPIKLPELSRDVSGEPVKITGKSGFTVYINVSRTKKVMRILENAVSGR
ncbi:MAG: hypothetical protein IIZ18_03550 [Ruminococcus sp.]|nr:hypothetical protein [Ruminococcus sp.]